MIPPIQGLLGTASGQAVAGNDSRLNSVFRTKFPGVLNISENSLICLESYDVARTVYKLKASVQAAPVGADILVSFYPIVLATGVVGAKIGQVDIPAASFTAILAVNPGIAIPVGSGVLVTIDQVGS